MLKQLQKVSLFILFISCQAVSFCQSEGFDLIDQMIGRNIHYLPFVSGKYEENGIKFSEIEISLEGYVWVSNKLPINKTFEVIMNEPTGFVVENGICYPGISLIIKNSKNDTLANVPNVYEDKTDGFDLESLKSLTMSLGFNEQSKVGDTLLLEIVFFDTKSDKKTKIDFSTIIVDSKLPLNNPSSSYSFKSYTGYKVSSSMDIPNVKNEYTSINNEEYEILTLKEINIEEKNLSKMKTSLTVYDNQINIIDPNKISVSLNVEKEMNLEKGTCNLIFTSKRKKQTDIERFWMFRLENLETNEVIEVFNKF